MSKVTTKSADSATQKNSVRAYEEERIPFDDVMRRLLKAKPHHKTAAKPAKAPAKKK